MDSMTRHWLSFKSFWWIEPKSVLCKGKIRMHIGVDLTKIWSVFVYSSSRLRSSLTERERVYTLNIFFQEIINSEFGVMVNLPHFVSFLNLPHSALCSKPASIYLILKSDSFLKPGSFSKLGLFCLIFKSASFYLILKSASIFFILESASFLFIWVCLLHTDTCVCSIWMCLLYLNVSTLRFMCT